MSKASLAASSIQHEFNHSPSQSQSVKREFRQLQKWLDGREINLVSQLDATVDPKDAVDVNS
jgi:hypothetical protein